MLFNRIKQTLDQRQPYDQHGFRPGCSIEDALSTVEGLVGRALEFQHVLWILSLDLRRAFDRVEFDSLFQALRQDGVDEPHLHLLSLLYSKQLGVVKGQAMFFIQRGVKQGDIMSPILFNAALEMAFRRWKRRLTHHGWLLKRDAERLTNSRVADDILLYAKSLEELTQMSNWLLEELLQIGLAANAAKSKVLTTCDDFSDGSTTYIF